MSFMKIVNVYGREILDSRGNPTVEAEVTLDNGIVCDYYKSNTKGYGSTLVFTVEDMFCTLDIDNNLEGWEDEELLKIANGIRAKYEDGTME